GREAPEQQGAQFDVVDCHEVPKKYLNDSKSRFRTERRYFLRIVFDCRQILNFVCKKASGGRRRVYCRIGGATISGGERGGSAACPRMRAGGGTALSRLDERLAQRFRRHRLG